MIDMQITITDVTSTISGCYSAIACPNVCICSCSSPLWTTRARYDLTSSRNQRNCLTVFWGGLKENKILLLLLLTKGSATVKSTARPSCLVGILFDNYREKINRSTANQPLLRNWPRN